MVVMWGMLIELGGGGLYFIVDYMHSHGISALLAINK